MDGGDGDLRFDFEDDLDVAGAGSGYACASSDAPGAGYFSPCASSDAPIPAAGGLSHARGRGNIDTDGDLWFDFEDDLDIAGAGFGSACASFDSAGAGYFFPCASSDAPIPAAGGPSHARGRGNIEVDGDDGDLRFDFEDYLDAIGAGSGSSETPIPAEEGRPHGRGRGNFRQTVCQLDEERMPCAASSAHLATAAHRIASSSTSPRSAKCIDMDFALMDLIAGTGMLSNLGRLLLLRKSSRSLNR